MEARDRERFIENDRRSRFPESPGPLVRANSDQLSRVAYDRDRGDRDRGRMVWTPGYHTPAAAHGGPHRGGSDRMDDDQRFDSITNPSRRSYSPVADNAAASSVIDSSSPRAVSGHIPLASSSMTMPMTMPAGSLGQSFGQSVFARQQRDFPPVRRFVNQSFGFEYEFRKRTLGVGGAIRPSVGLPYARNWGARPADGGNHQLSNQSNQHLIGKGYSSVHRQPMQRPFSQQPVGSNDSDQHRQGRPLNRFRSGEFGASMHGYGFGQRQTGLGPSPNVGSGARLGVSGSRFSQQLSGAALHGSHGHGHGQQGFRSSFANSRPRMGDCASYVKALNSTEREEGEAEPNDEEDNNLGTDSNGGGNRCDGDRTMTDVAGTEGRNDANDDTEYVEEQLPVRFMSGMCKCMCML